MASNDSMVGKVGRVVRTINTDDLGEVMFNTRGGTDTFMAYSDETTSLGSSAIRKCFGVGDKVIVTEQLGRRVGVKTAADTQPLTTN